VKAEEIEEVSPQALQTAKKRKLSDSFLGDVQDAWAKYGTKVLKHMAENDPTNFLRVVAQLMPKDVLVDARGAGIVIVKMSPEDLAV
jgi:hypothetical protein